VALGQAPAHGRFSGPHQTNKNNVAHGRQSIRR
jgi:hypothetical protein